MSARKVSSEEAKQFATNKGFYYLEASAKTNENECVSKAFDQLVGEMLNRKHAAQESQHQQDKLRKSQIKVGVEEITQTQKNKKCC